MSDPQIDPDLLGIWIIPGEPSTYEISETGSYHIAEPPDVFSIYRNGQGMKWGSADFERVLGEGDTLEGVWRDSNSRDEWYFRPDGSYTLHWPDGEETHGIWALQGNGETLWTREDLAQLETNGAQVTFRLHSGAPATYGYTVKGDIWTLLNPQSWDILVEYRRA